MYNLKHNPDELIALLTTITKKVRSLSKGQFWGVLYLKYWPHGPEKMVAEIVKFCEGITHTYVNCSKAEVSSPTFEQWQSVVSLTKELDFRLNQLYWGEYNNNRSVIDPKLWGPLNISAVTLNQVISLIKGEFKYETT